VWCACRLYPRADELERLRAALEAAAPGMEAGTLAHSAEHLRVLLKRDQRRGLLLVAAARRRRQQDEKAGAAGAPEAQAQQGNQEGGLARLTRRAALRAGVVRRRLGQGSARKLDAVAGLDRAWTWE
jgi:hypothetical protein